MLDTAVTIPAPGYSLTAASSFLAGFPPAGVDVGGVHEPLVLPLVVEATWQPAVAVVTQPASHVLDVEVHGGAPVDAVAAQVRRVLGVDLDHRGFDATCAADPVLGAARRRHPDLRPVLFGSTYQALVWAILSQRTSMAAASAASRRLAVAHGTAVEAGGRRVHVLPAPDRLAAVVPTTGVDHRRVVRLRRLAAATDGEELTADGLLAVAPSVALERLRRLDGIGPFSAELALVRGAGAPDVFPRHEPRLHRAMRERYRRPVASVDELDAIATRWSPHRSWAAFLLRVAGANEARGAERPRPNAGVAG